MSVVHDREEAGPSWRILALSFFILVALCAVVFSLGYMVGYKERPQDEAISTETLPSPGPSATAPIAQTPSATPAHQGMKAPREKASSKMSTSNRSIATTHSSTTFRPISPTPLRKSARVMPATTQRAVRGGRFEVQVAASSAETDALHLARILKSRGFPASVVTPENSGAHDSLYRVEVGPYKTRADAEIVRGQLTHAGFGKPFIRP